MRSKLFPLVVLVALSILVVAGLMTAFDALHVAKSTGTPSPKSWVDISPEGDLQPHVLLFVVQGATHTSYLRATAATTYDLGAGMWRLPQDSQHRDYDGELLVRVVPDSVQEAVTDEIEVLETNSPPDYLTTSPLIPLPTSLYPVQVSYPSLLTYFPEEDVFLAQQSGLSPYSFATVHYSFDNSTLRQAGPAPDEVYLELPGGMSKKIRELAGDITANLDSPYEKARAIEAYLKANYFYDPGYFRAQDVYDPDGSLRAQGRTEPNYWFLFEEKKGLCANFNSAFVVLCRAAGVPARLVSGYKITPQFEEQEVYADQAHTWAEVGLDGLGWITFDATGSPEQPTPPEPPESLRPTVTTIDQIAGTGEALKKGDSFTVWGTVKTLILGMEEPVADLEVGVWISHSKVIESSYPWLIDPDTLIESPTRILVGRGITSSAGTFEAKCTVPSEVQAGDYHVLAHVEPTEEYQESWSDPEIKVISETSIKITPPEEFKVNEPVKIGGALREEPSYIQYKLRRRPHGGGLVSVRGWHPVPGEEVAVYVDGKLVGEMTTNDAGEFSLNYTFAERRSYNITMEFKGADYYLASSSELSVGPPHFPWLYLVIPLALGGALAGYLVYLFRRRRGKRYSRFRFYWLLLSAFAGIGFAAYGLHERALYPWILLALIPGVTWLVPWLAYPLMRRAYSFFRRLWRRLRPPAGTTPEIAPETEPAVEGSGVAKAVPALETLERKEAIAGPVAIDFPQIREGLPDVWGAGDELQIRGSLRDGNGGGAVAADTMEFYLDKDLLGTTTVDETGKGGLAHTIETKGEYVIGGRLGADSGERLIKIADYREEIIGLFNSLLQRLQSQGIGIRLGATPREIQQRLLSAQIEIDERLLDQIVGCFEEADYSQHPIGRHHYEVMYLSQQALFGEG
jgi:transglutaminase-like putative cysteine protease